MPKTRRYKFAVEPVRVDIDGTIYSGSPAITEQVWSAWDAVGKDDFRRRNLILAAITFGLTETDISRLPVAVSTVLQEVSNEINQLEVIKDTGEDEKAVPKG